MIGDVIACVFVWLLMGVIYFCNDVIHSRHGPDSWWETFVLIVFWPLRVIGVLK